MANREEAERIVKALATRYGYLDKEMMDHIGAINPEYRRVIEGSFSGLEETAAHSIKTLAKHIYGSGARFVFELLQNAEDNKYSNAIRNGQAPFVLFKVYPTHVVVECNEDGFNERDMHAICAVGKSTKSASYGYIGAKGIGFKSVFIAAWRVVVQSGHYSFEFNHRKHDPGLGMVRPLWIKDAEYLGNQLTRMTLYFHDNMGPADADHLRKTVGDQFTQLEQTCLLFLTKLKSIDIEFYNDQGWLTGSRGFKKSTVENDSHCVKLDTQIFENGRHTSETHIYHIAETTAINLPLSEGREISSSSTGDGVQGTSAKVVLAFPLTPGFQPNATHDTDLFAFLPVSKSRYKFIIQSDFDTKADREGIVFTSRRNIALRDAIAAAFIQGVLQFCEHETLRYSWPLFLPSLSDDYPSFWAALNEELGRRIKSTPLFKARTGISMRRIDKVLILPSNVRDANGEPLLDHPSKSHFLSSLYARSSIQRLKEYGLEESGFGLFYSLLKDDMSSQQPKMHQASTSADWQRAVAKMIHKSVVNKKTCSGAAFTLPLIPLKDGTWVSASSASLYFPTAEGIDVPVLLDIEVLDPVAASDTQRKDLFIALGVKYPSVGLVRNSIFRAFSDDQPRAPWNWRFYLRFLYQTHLSREELSEKRHEICMQTEDNVMRRPSTYDMYIRQSQSHQYGPETLLSPTDDAPGLSTCFVDRQTAHPQEQPTPSHPTWTRWLHDYAGVRERLRLLSADGSALSSEFTYIFEHRTDDFLGYLQYLWPHEGEKLRQKGSLVRKVRSLPARGLCRVEFDIALEKTWLPKTDIRDAVTKYIGQPESFPFLKLPEPQWSDPVTIKWEFLTEAFSVRHSHGIDLLLDILYYAQEADPEPTSPDGYQKTLDLYIALYSLLITKKSTHEYDRVKEFFTSRGVLIPGQGDREGMWTSSSSCVWKGPPGMACKHTLHGLYSKLVDTSQMIHIQQLAKEVLGILPVTAAQLIEELTASSTAGDDDFAKIKALYKYLQKLKPDWQTARQSFRENPLVYVRQSRNNQRGWYKTSDCLWSSSMPISGKAILEEDYQDMRDFFVEELGVISLTLKMVYDELKQGEWGDRIEELKRNIASFNSLLLTDPEPLDAEELKSAIIFPVKYGGRSPAVRSIKASFAIPDRDYLKDRFETRATLLDFDLEQVRRLAPFFRWANLEHLYLSNCVQETTSVSGTSSRPVSSRNRDLHRKAYYILRVAATFASPRYQADPQQFYQLLRTTRVVETNDLVSTLTLKYGDEEIQCEEDAGAEHIDEGSTGLTIYVPRKKRAQEVCFADALPRKLAQWLLQRNGSKAGDTELVSVLKTVLACDRVVLDEVLNKEGIVEVPIENEDEPGDYEPDSDSEDEMQQQDEPRVTGDDSGPPSPAQINTPTHSTLQGSPRASTATPEAELEVKNGESVTLDEVVSAQSRMARQSSPRLPSLSHFPSSESPEQARPSRPDFTPMSPAPSSGNALASEGHPRSPVNATPAVPPPRDTDDTLSSVRSYRLILNNVVNAARQAGFPARGAFDMSHLRQALPTVASGGTYDGYDGIELTHTRFKSGSQLERDMKIGAAGELYVFEVLSGLSLPNWGRGNWQSNIRALTHVHADYTGIQNWGSRETADLVYHDSEGQLTSMLIDYGYMSRDDWQGARPKYYLEVKTTTGPLETPFYVSNNQLRLMKQAHEVNDRSEVYMVLRVYSVAGSSSDIKMGVYLDPEQLRRQGSLVFTAPTWSVVPGNGR